MFFKWRAKKVNLAPRLSFPSSNKGKCQRMELISSSASYSCGEASTLGQNSEKSSMNIEYALKYIVNINIKEPKYRLNHRKI